MGKVWVRPIRKRGRDKLVTEKQADALVRLGLYEYGQTPVEPEPVVPDYASMPYNELRRLVKERDLTPEGTRKDDLIRALGGYLRRDMRAG